MTQKNSTLKDKNLKKITNKKILMTNISQKINALKTANLNDKNSKIDCSNIFEKLQTINLKENSQKIKKLQIKKIKKENPQIKIKGVKKRDNDKIEVNKIKGPLKPKQKTQNHFKFLKKLATKRKIKRILKCNKKLKDRFYSKFRNQSPKISHSIKIWIKANNVFCICTDNKTNKTVNFCNSGMYKIPTSKRKVKHTYMLIFNKFIAETKKKVKIRGLMFTISCPKRLRYKLLKRFPARFKKMPLVINVLDKKIFNGCRPAKKIRKKRRTMRVYK